MRFAVLLFLLMAAFQQSWAQAQQILHHTVDLNPAITIVKTDIVANFLGVETWPGNHILLETKVEIHGLSDGVLKHFLEHDRYTVETKIENNTLLLVSKEKERKPLKTKSGECVERVHYRVFIPEAFVASGKNQWTRPAEEAEAPAIEQLDKKG